MWVLEPGHSCPVLGASEQPLLGHSHWLGWTHLRTAMTLKCLLPCSPFFPFSFLTAIAPGGRSCLLPLPSFETPKTHSSLSASISRPELTQVGFRAASPLHPRNGGNCPGESTSLHAGTRKKHSFSTPFFGFVLPKMYVYLYAFVSLFVSSLPYL